MSGQPEIVAVLEVGTTDGYGGMYARRSSHPLPDGVKAPSGRVHLYAWSDGVVTWTETRADAPAPGAKPRTQHFRRPYTVNQSWCGAPMDPLVDLKVGETVIMCSACLAMKR